MYDDVTTSDSFCNNSGFVVIINLNVWVIYSNLFGGGVLRLLWFLAQ